MTVAAQLGRHTAKGNTKMTTYRMNLAIADADERVQTGYQQDIDGVSRDEAVDLYRIWLLESGWEQDALEGRILIDEVKI